ncbi:MarR family transcriptional regulator [Agromyces sp. H3Y2-19a]|jgi:DNA-binding MarR family transcriptional regulator|uniref:MarR family winged helix-turn-helix transcriptional regulator n=1 Tax=Agromyces TaxID=33877 RepID=UPI001E398AB2|nr:MULTISPECIES: MarR family transcriptional regulator [Agromyces]MCD5348008.1 MarR family transcriptional regulator [Agromyces sp. S2-1-8]MDF0514395.1 MarR family transcriptional regulator [Agromyces chromiiresistens]
MTDDTKWLNAEESAAWVRLIAVAELLPGALDAQLLRDAGLTHFEYVALMALADAPSRTMRMTELASRTNATLPRLSHVARRLEERGLIRRFPCPEDRRATNATITEAGLDLMAEAAPGHVDTVRANVFDALTAEQLEQLYVIAGAVLAKLDPDERLTATSCQFSEGPVVRTLAG